MVQGSSYVYHVFCDSREISEKDRTPAKAVLVASFISVLKGSLSGKAIHNYIYGMWAWHTLYGLPWVLHEEQIATMLKGVAKLTPPTLKQDKSQCELLTVCLLFTLTHLYLLEVSYFLFSSVNPKHAESQGPFNAARTKCKPVTTQMISVIKDKLDQTNPFDAAFFTCLTTTFYTAAWVGEFMLQRLNAFNPVEHITRGGVHDDINRNSLHTKVFTLLCTKSSPTGKEVHWGR